MEYIKALQNLLEKAEREKDTHRAQVLKELLKQETHNN